MAKFRPSFHPKFHEIDRNNYLDSSIYVLVTSFCALPLVDMADGEIATGRSPEKQDKEEEEMEEEDPGEDLYEVERVIGKSKIKVSFFSSFVCLFSS